MKVLLIHQAFASLNEPGGTRHLELGQYLVNAGHQFTVVATDTSYQNGKRIIDRKGLFAEENVNGVRVLRTWIHRPFQRSYFQRVISFLSFMFSSVCTALRAGPLDLVMGTTPPIFQAVSAWIVSALRRCPFLLEVRDLWPEFAIDMGVLKSPALIRLSRWVETFLYSRASHILVNSPAYRDYLIRKGVSAERISFISNGVDPRMFDPAKNGNQLREEFHLRNQFVVLYAGALGVANDIPTLLRAAAHMRDDPNIHFLLVGDGKERRNLEAQARSLLLNNVTFCGSRPKNQMNDILAGADACVAILRPIRMFRTTYPNKVFDYMAAGRPTILAIDGVIREVIEAAEGGVFVTPGDDNALAKAVRDLSRDRGLAATMGKNARAYVCEHFDRRRHAAQFVEMVERFDTMSQV